MARTARVKSTAKGRMHYHLISRASNRQFLFVKDAPKDKLMELARRAAEFSGVKLVAVAIMSNHFHILCEVERTGEPVPQDEVLRRIGVLKGAKAAGEMEAGWRGLAAAGFYATLEKEVDRWRARMNDISEYMKTMKELFAIWYKREYGYTGSLWDGAFKSTMVERGRHLEFCRRYIMMNPIRAGIVGQLKDYRWAWASDEGSSSAGCLPAAGCMAKVAQVGSGKVFGSEAFVRDWIARLGDKWRAGHTAAHRVGEIGYSTHGWRLAKADDRAA
jgi:REP element-mobilizing transposase RayT